MLSLLSLFVTPQAYWQRNGFGLYYLSSQYSFMIGAGIAYIVNIVMVLRKPL